MYAGCSETSFLVAWKIKKKKDVMQEGPKRAGAPLSKEEENGRMIRTKSMLATKDEACQGINPKRRTQLASSIIVMQLKVVVDALGACARQSTT